MVPCANSTLRSCLPSFDDATTCDSMSLRTSGAGRSGFALRGRGERVFSGFSFGPALMRISVEPWAGQSAAPEGPDATRGTTSMDLIPAPGCLYFGKDGSGRYRHRHWLPRFAGFGWTLTRESSGFGDLKSSSGPCKIA